MSVRVSITRGLCRFRFGICDRLATPTLYACRGQRRMKRVGVHGQAGSLDEFDSKLSQSERAVRFNNRYQVLAVLIIQLAASARLAHCRLRPSRADSISYM